MPQVPTILTEGPLRGQMQGGADPADFGVQVGQAVQGLGQSIGQAGVTAAQITSQREAMNNAQWIGESIEQEKNYINKWMADPANNSKETYADDLQKLMQQRVAEYDKSAPNARARQQFRDEFRNFGISRYDSALQTSAQTKIQGSVTSIQSQIDQSIEGYRSARDVPNIDANGDLVSSVASISQRIDQTFGVIAPNMARQLKDKLIINATYAAMDSSPDLARKILNMGNIEGSRRHTIENQIDQAQSSRNMTDVVAFDAMRKNWLTLAESGKQRDKIPLVQYQSIYSRDEAIAQKARDDAQIDVFNGSNDFVNRVSPMSAGAQLTELNKLADSIGADPAKAYQNSRIVELAAQRVAENVKKIARDPVGYMSQNVPMIRGLRDQLAAMDEKSPSYESTKRSLFDAVLKYQGPPPSSDSTLDKSDDPSLYHNVPRNSVSLMTTEEASQHAAQINQGSPKDALKSILSVLQQYPEQYQAIAFKDMVKLPGDRGIRGEYWAAALNKSAPWVDDYLGVIQNAGAIKKSSVATEGELEKALNGNTTWLQFARPIASDNFQRQGIVEDFRSGIMLYGMALVQQRGLSPEKAIDLASQRLLNEEMGIVDVNGKPTMVPRNQGDSKPMRTDSDIDDIGRRLKLAINYIDVKQLKLQDEYGRSLFPVLEMAGTQEAKDRAIRDAIQINGTFQTTPDGKAAVLYYDDGENHFEMRDANNRAFVVSFDDLPAFEVGPAVRGAFGFNLGQKTNLPPAPGAPVITEVQRPPTPQDDPISYAFTGTVGTGIFTTNWPSMPTWIRREAR